MTTRDAFVQKVKSRLDQWNAEVDKLEAKASEAAADKRIQYKDQIQAIKERKADIQGRLKKLMDAGEDAWDELKSGIEKAMESAETPQSARFEAKEEAEAVH